MIKEYFYIISSGIKEAYNGFINIWNVKLDISGSPDMMIPLENYKPNAFDDINKAMGDYLPVGHYCMYLVIMLVAGGIIAQIIKDSGAGKTKGIGKRGKNNLLKRMGNE